MTLIERVAHCSAAVTLFLASGALLAAPVSYAWEGVISRIDMNYANGAPTVPFSYSYGQTISGTIRFDPREKPLPYSPTQSQYSAITTFNIGGHAIYPTTSTGEMWVFDDDMSISWDGQVGMDKLQTFFARYEIFPGYDIHGGFDLYDPSGTSFASATAPDHLELQNYSTTLWALWIHGAGGRELIDPWIELSGRVTSLVLVREVPEPTSSAVIVAGFLAMAACRRRQVAGKRESCTGTDNPAA